MRYVGMSSSSDPEKQIAETKELITRAEERVRKLQARAQPGASRIVHALTNNIRRYRRDLHKLLARQADQANQNEQLRKQQAQMQQAQRDASPDRRSELPERQDQESRKPASNQGRGAGQ
jgi:hypothetical protein